MDGFGPACCMWIRDPLKGTPSWGSYCLKGFKNMYTILYYLIIYAVVIVLALINNILNDTLKRLRDFLT